MIKVVNFLFIITTSQWAYSMVQWILKLETFNFSVVAQLHEQTNRVSAKFEAKSPNQRLVLLKSECQIREFKPWKSTNGRICLERIFSKWGIKTGKKKNPIVTWKRGQRLLISGERRKYLLRSLF